MGCWLWQLHLLHIYAGLQPCPCLQSPHDLQSAACGEPERQHLHLQHPLQLRCTGCKGCCGRHPQGCRLRRPGSAHDWWHAPLHIRVRHVRLVSRPAAPCKCETGGQVKNCAIESWVLTLGTCIMSGHLWACCSGAVVLCTTVDLSLMLDSCCSSCWTRLSDSALGLCQHGRTQAARSTAGDSPLPSPQGSWLRHAWVVCRMAPEILLGQQCSLSVDIYSYGTVCTVELGRSKLTACGSPACSALGCAWIWRPQHMPDSLSLSAARPCVFAVKCTASDGHL